MTANKSSAASENDENNNDVIGLLDVEGAPYSAFGLIESNLLRDHLGLKENSHL